MRGLFMALTNDQIRQEASQILMGEDFQRYSDKAAQWDFWRWLREHLNWQFPFESQSSLAVWKLLGVLLKFVLIALILWFVGYLLYTLWKKLFSPSQETEQRLSVTSAERREARESYVRLAHEALSAQDYRLAIHYLFLATVSLVIRDTNFHQAEYMTNREIARLTDFSRFSRAGQLKAVFEMMVHFDEPRWFGTQPASQSDYEQFEQYYRAFEQGDTTAHA